jgi:hypothetical protein
VKWLERLFHEPRDPEVDVIKKALKDESERHSRELTKINGALADLGQAYEIAEQERRGEEP